jgi:hypothetical protein
MNVKDCELNYIVDMVNRYVQDNDHGLTIIHVNPMVKEIYFYV